MRIDHGGWQSCGRREARCPGNCSDLPRRAQWYHRAAARTRVDKMDVSDTPRRETVSSPIPHHLNLASPDVARTAAFYRDLLGLEPAELPRDRSAYGAKIAILQDE